MVSAHRTASSSVGHTAQHAGLVMISNSSVNKSPRLETNTEEAARNKVVVEVPTLEEAIKGEGMAETKLRMQSESSNN
jgi:hypothetical protein